MFIEIIKMRRTLVYRVLNMARNLKKKLKMYIPYNSPLTYKDTNYLSIKISVICKFNKNFQYTNSVY
jgi:hypothetical protein